MNDESPSANKPSITLTDISAVVEVLRVVTERGVWKANELSTVGALYDRLSTFLDQASAANKAAEPQDAPAE